MQLLNLRVWWEACQLAALVLPWSATAERVFSLTKNLFGEQQTRFLSDAIRLGICWLTTLSEKRIGCSWLVQLPLLCDSLHESLLTFVVNIPSSSQYFCSNVNSSDLI